MDAAVPLPKISSREEREKREHLPITAHQLSTMSNNPHNNRIRRQRRGKARSADDLDLEVGVGNAMKRAGESGVTRLQSLRARVLGMLSLPMLSEEEGDKILWDICLVSSQDVHVVERVH